MVIQLTLVLVLVDGFLLSSDHFTRLGLLSVQGCRQLVSVHEQTRAISQTN